MLIILTKLNFFFESNFKGGKIILEAQLYSINQFTPSWFLSNVNIATTLTTYFEPIQE